MGKPNRRASLLCFIALGFLTWSPELSARRAGPCGDQHGAYTSVLCPDDDLISGSYIRSPNGNYRFYVGSGDALVFDVSSENWGLLYYVFQPPPSAYRFTYGDPDVPGFTPSNYAVRDASDEFIGGFAPEFYPDGEHFLRLDDDGCLRVYDQGGNRNIWQLTGWEGCSGAPAAKPVITLLGLQSSAVVIQNCAPRHGHVPVIDRFPAILRSSHARTFGHGDCVDNDFGSVLRLPVRFSPHGRARANVTDPWRQREETVTGIFSLNGAFERAVLPDTT